MTIGHRVVGSGPQGVIVNHGWFGPDAFEPMLPYLDTTTFSYAFMDCRGYGASKDMPGEHTMAEIASDVVGLAEDLGWQRFHLLGHSMGGMALCRLTVDVPERIKSAVALNPVPASGVPMDADNWALFSAAPDEDDKRRAILDFTTGGRLCDRWLDGMVRSSRAGSDREAFRDYLTAWVKTDFAEQCKGNGTPIKVLVGEHDPALNEEVMNQTYMSWYDNAELEVLTNAGHYPMLETPVYLATTIERFMKRFV